MNKGNSVFPSPPPSHTHRYTHPCLGPRQTEWLRCLTVDPDGIQTWWQWGWGQLVSARGICRARSDGRDGDRTGCECAWGVGRGLRESVSWGG